MFTKLSKNKLSLGAIFALSFLSLLFLLLVHSMYSPIAAQSTTATPTHTLPAGNVIVSDDFESGSTAAWYGFSNITLDATDGELCATISDPGEFVWDVQTGLQARYLIESGHDYRVTFDAYASADTQINALVSMDHDPWLYYLLETLSLTTEKQSFQYDFTMTQDTDSSSLLAFQMGAQQAGEVCLDNVVLTETGVPAATPTPLYTPTPPPTATPTSTPIPADEQCDVTIHRWYGGADSALSLTFDDGYESQYTHLRPILNERDLLSTFYVNPGFQGVGAYASWAQWAEMSADGHEIAAHTMRHPYLTTLDQGDEITPNTLRYELAESKQQIEANLGISVTTFAYPFGANNSIVREATADYFIASRLATSSFAFNSETVPDWMQVSAHGPLYDTPRDTPSSDNDELIETENWVQTNVIDNQGWGVLLWHTVIPFIELAGDTSYQPVTTEWMSEFTDWLLPRVDSGELWVGTVNDIAQYIQMRESVGCVIVAESAAALTLNFTDPLDNTVYDQPLTAEIVVPAEWEMVSASYDDQSEMIAPISNGSEMVIQLDIVPDNGNVVLASSDQLPMGILTRTITQTVSSPVWLLLPILLASGVLYLKTMTKRQG